VHFQLERTARDDQDVPAALRQGRLLAAVYRVQAPTRSGGRQGLALRLLVAPTRHSAASESSLTERAAVGSERSLCDLSFDPPPVQIETSGHLVSDHV
jgi:hypothetical protein